MDAPNLTLALLFTTLVLNVGHVGIHLVTTMVRRADRLPWYDAWVGYGGALAWFSMVIVDRGTLGWLPSYAVLIGLLLTGAGLYVHGRGIRDIMAPRREGALVTEGIYRRLRHPIYYGWVVVSFGMPLVSGSWWGLLTAPVWSGLILAVGVLEERDMARRFPDGEYGDYLQDTWF
jgi:protein-S-isoprenylcysteine O-methyltransferase Ste14